LVVVYHIVDVLRVGLGEWLTVMSADPEIVVIGGLITFDVCTELLADGKSDDGVGDGNVGNTDPIDRVPLSICNGAMV